MSDPNKEPIQPGTFDSIRDIHFWPLIGIGTFLAVLLLLMFLAGTEDRYLEVAISLVSESVGRFSLVLSAIVSIFANAYFLFVDNESVRLRQTRRFMQELSIDIGLAFIVLAILMGTTKGLQLLMVSFLAVGPFFLNYISNHFQPKNIKRKSQNTKRHLKNALSILFVLVVVCMFTNSGKVNLWVAGKKAHLSSELSKHCKNETVSKEICIFIYETTM
ncbi:hypothetical protein AB4455_12160 [Vibrio sp. 10N.261.46.E12]|uniref:hypothetical protein n=1 Tax=unclassified Vibrio TaxID=2614977 RepID=UPI000978D1B5|nr:MULTISPECIES: hypothetical protein [unclassified Vibrio]OMO34190.1 hypothetical protein BH584_13305 [Vibrio sp. 10N.261.45.E1]PMJ33161.1 hypothetical protein BCU27_25295 [Vibrio sp. 10N.286.45.B6]PML86349.1 hypothetical protein BCT66_14255 [Vibrio sp. 10N.261.49.E11]PMM77465.1 hypothetical protein BCT48_23695 [Vibrio sp. 10N.261.46.F12]PMM90634.1 hypothetical protein BCT46_03425 [Vibrio sp. 10N.261.46.E8]